MRVLMGDKPGWEDGLRDHRPASGGLRVNAGYRYYRESGQVRQ
jgi:hypothetical protein